MKSFCDLLQKLRRNRQGATAIEYALIASLIFLAVAGSIGVTGFNVEAFYNSIASSVANAANG